MKLKLGITVKDKITDFEGIIVGHADYITGCDTYLVQPKCEKSGIKPTGEWIDEDRLIVIGKSIVEKITVTGKANGADIEAPKK